MEYEPIVNEFFRLWALREVRRQEQSAINKLYKQKLVQVIPILRGVDKKTFTSGDYVMKLESKDVPIGSSVEATVHAYIRFQKTAHNRDVTEDEKVAFAELLKSTRRERKDTKEEVLVYRNLVQ